MYPARRPNHDFPLTAAEQIRRQINGELVPKIAELLYQSDKGHRMAKLADLSEDNQQVYLADALMLTSTESRFERVQRVHVNDAHGHALIEDEHETVMRNARHDVATFGRVRPGYCYVCKQPVGPCDTAVVFVTPNLQAEGHGLCFAKDDARFELIAEFRYRLKEDRRG